MTSSHFTDDQTYVFSIKKDSEEGIDAISEVLWHNPFLVRLDENFVTQTLLPAVGVLRKHTENSEKRPTKKRRKV